MMLAGGLLGGLIAALALALLAEYFDHSVKSVDDVERMLQVPALASIPRLHARQVRLQPAGKITQHDYAHS
jgi:capsular polysaccharide biosynthesis protein